MMPSLYGNRFVIGEHGDRDQVCNRCECEQLPDMDVSALTGKDLICFCWPHRCHGDSILRKANHRVLVFGGRHYADRRTPVSSSGRQPRAAEDHLHH